MDVVQGLQRSHPHPRSQATICYDPFHIMQWVNRALDRGLCRGRHRARPGLDEHPRSGRPPAGRCAPGRTNSPMTNAPWSTRSPAPTAASAAPGRSKNNCATSTASTTRPAAPANTCAAGSPPPNAAASTPSSPWPNGSRSTSSAVIAAIELGISNALIEGINAKIRLINARGYGHHSAQTLTSMIYLCLGGLQPTATHKNLRSRILVRCADKSPRRAVCCGGGSVPAAWRIGGGFSGHSIPQQVCEQSKHQRPGKNYAWSAVFGWCAVRVSNPGPAD